MESRKKLNGYCILSWQAREKLKLSPLYFSCNVEFHYPEGIEQFEDQLEDFKPCSNTAKLNDNMYLSDEENIVNSGFGGKTKCDQFILTDNVSGLTNELKKIVKKQSHINLIIRVFTFFKQSTQKNQSGEPFFHKF